MLGGLYGDLLPPSDEDNQPSSNTMVWSSSAKMAPPTLRKPFFGFAPPQTVLRSQNKPKNPVPKTIVSSVPASISPSPAAVSTEGMAQLQHALVGVTSSVIGKYDPARPNDYEEYSRERKRKAMEEEMRRELEKMRREEEERDREREERERERDFNDSRLNISGKEAWRRRAAMSGGVPRSPMSFTGKS